MINKKKLDDEIKKNQFYKLFQIKQIVNKRTRIKSEGKNKFKGCFEKLKGQIWKSRRIGEKRIKNHWRQTEDP